MKRIVALIMIGTLAFSFTACGSSESDTETTQEETTSDANEDGSDMSVDDALQAYMDKGENLNRSDLITHLETNYAEDEAKKAVDNADIDWQDLALENANDILHGSDEHTEDEIRDQLEDKEFTSDEIDYAIKNADWK